jgi:hypothetical protein
MIRPISGLLALSIVSALQAQTVPPAPNAGGTPASLPAIRVSENGRYFVTAEGKPFFWQGDTAWCIFNRPSPAEVDLYLDDRKAKGFNVIQGCVAVWDHTTRRNPDGQTPFNNAGRGATGNPTINEAFYKNVDEIIDKCAKRGMYVAMLPFWTKNTRSGVYNDPAVMGPYCEFLAKRYASKNVFFVLGGDTAADPAIRPAIDAEAAGLLKGAKEAGVAKIMVTYHPTGRQSSSFWYQDAAWLDFNSIQSGHFINTTNFQLVGDDYAKTPVKPTLDTEPGYENITNNLVRDASAATAPRIQAVDIRRSAYLAVFAGAAGHTYGNGEVYEFYAGGVPAGSAGWHANMNWKEALKLPGAGQVQFVRYLIESRPMLERVPDQTLIAGGPGTVVPDLLPQEGNAEIGRGPARGGARGPRVSAIDRVCAMRGSSGDYAFIYLPTGQTKVTVNTSKLTGEQITAWWYDPRTGESVKIDTAAKGATREFTLPAPNEKVAATNNDWVLVLDNAAKNFAAPGKH